MMSIDRAGIPFIVVPLVLALWPLFLRRPLWAIPFVVLAACFAFFFRDPEREIARDPNAVLSPADGRVLVAGEADPASAPPGRWLQVSVFLSPFDVHVNRAPVSGRVIRVEHDAGGFLPAYKREAAGNTRNEIWVDHDGETIVFRQVVGILARRLVCRVTPGQYVEAGQRIGIMKFGSRMDVFVSPAAVLRVRVGDKVRAGVSVLAVLRPKDPPSQPRQ